MEGFFNPNSVAVIGVSNSPVNLGRAIVFNLMEFQYQGCIYLVGPKEGAFLGHKIYPSVLDIPEAVDLAAVLVPAASVPEVLRQCGEKGIRRVVVESAGFAELGRDRIPLQERMRDILDRYGMRMIGPNCLGVMNRKNGLALPFMPLKAEAPLGRTAIVAQSGGVAAMMFNAFTAEHMGFGKFASIGNKLDVNEVDLLEHLSGDEDTDIVFCYLEGLSDARRLMEVAGRSAKPVIVHKSNRGKAVAAIARSHSASLSSDDAAADAAFRQCGVIRAFELNDAIGKVKAFLLPRMKGNRLAVISRSGGHAVMAADAAEEFGFELPPFPGEIGKLVSEHARAGVIKPRNPLDLGDVFNLPLYGTLAQKVLELEEFDGIVFIHNYQGIFDAEESRRLIKGMEAVMAGTGKPAAVCVFPTQSELNCNRKAVRFPIFLDPREAIRALAMNRDRHTVKVLPFPGERPFSADPRAVRAELSDVSPGPVPAPVLGRMLAAYGVGLTPWEAAEDEDSAVAAADRLGYPAAIKTAEPWVVHKSDVGGVRLNVPDAYSARIAYNALKEIGRRVLVAKMAEPGLEWFIGGKRDDQFGPVVILGLGGIYVEVFKETNMRVGPLGPEEAGRLLDESRGAALLGGVRGLPPLDRHALIDLLVRVSWFLHDFPEVRELDLNPVRSYPEGCLALDWRAVIEPRVDA